MPPITDPDFLLVADAAGTNYKVTAAILGNYVDSHTQINTTHQIQDTDFFLVSDAAGNNYKITAAALKTYTDAHVGSGGSNILASDWFLLSDAAGTNYRVNASDLADYLYNQSCGPGIEPVWTNVPDTFGTGIGGTHDHSGWESISYGMGRYVAWAAGYNSPGADNGGGPWYSDDGGTTWQRGTTEVAPDRPAIERANLNGYANLVSSIKFGADGSGTPMFAGVGQLGAGSTSILARDQEGPVMTSYNGINWHRRTYDIPLYEATTIAVENFSTIAYHAGLNTWSAAAWTPNRVASSTGNDSIRTIYSTDGINWFPAGETQSHDSAFFDSVPYPTGSFFIVGSGPHIWTGSDSLTYQGSGDGTSYGARFGFSVNVSWRSIDTDGAGKYRLLNAGTGISILGGSGGFTDDYQGPIYNSAGNRTDFVGRPQRIRYGGNAAICGEKWVAIGREWTVVTSDDGDNWTSWGQIPDAVRMSNVDGVRDLFFGGPAGAEKWWIVARESGITSIFSSSIRESGSRDGLMLCSNG